jgi:squalene synthase HpnC
VTAARIAEGADASAAVAEDGAATAAAACAEAGRARPPWVIEPQELARRHYENFPVVSWFVPRELRGALTAVYAFARMTDDLGDEGSAAPAQRLVSLARWEEGLEAALAARHPFADGLHPALARVAEAIRAHALPVEPFRAIIRANRLDQVRTRYPCYADLLEYCGYSANPVGRIVLRLLGRDDPSLLPASDAICTALQLANHWQGIGEDLRVRDRLYVPLEDLDRFGVREEDLRRHRPNRRVRRLVGFEVDRTRELLHSAALLPEAFGRNAAAVLRLFIAGGHAILDELEAHGDELLRGRLRVPRRRRLLLLAREGLRWARA